MKNSGVLQYVSDTLLIEDFYLVEQTLRSKGIAKQASGGAGFLSGLYGQITDWAKDELNFSSGGNIAHTLSKLLVPGVLFKINPILGVLYAAADHFGFGIDALILKVVNFAIKKHEEGEAPTLSEIESVGNSAVSSMAGPLDALDARGSSLFHLYEIKKEGKIVTSFFSEMKSMVGLQAEKTPSIPFFADKKLGFIGRIFDNLFEAKAKGKARWVIGGLVVWVLKTSLLGAGLLAGGAMVAGLLGSKKHEPATMTEDQKAVSQAGKDLTADEPDHETHTTKTYTFKFMPTGNGQDRHNTDPNKQWQCPLLNGDVEKTLFAWIKDVYQDPQGIFTKYESALKNTDAFEDALQKLESYKKGSVLIMPTTLHTRKQFVDSFFQKLITELAGVK